MSPYPFRDETPAPPPSMGVAVQYIVGLALIAVFAGVVWLIFGGA